MVNFSPLSQTSMVHTPTWIPRMTLTCNNCENLQGYDICYNNTIWKMYHRRSTLKNKGTNSNKSEAWMHPPTWISEIITWIPRMTVSCDNCEKWQGYSICYYIHYECTIKDQHWRTTWRITRRTKAWPPPPTIIAKMTLTCNKNLWTPVGDPLQFILIE